MGSTSTKEKGNDTFVIIGLLLSCNTNQTFLVRVKEKQKENVIKKRGVNNQI